MKPSSCPRRWRKRAAGSSRAPSCSSTQRLISSSPSVAGAASARPPRRAAPATNASRRGVGPADRAEPAPLRRWHEPERSGLRLAVSLDQRQTEALLERLPERQRRRRADRAPARTDASSGRAGRARRACRTSHRGIGTALAACRAMICGRRRCSSTIATTMIATAPSTAPVRAKSSRRGGRWEGDGRCSWPFSARPAGVFVTLCTAIASTRQRGKAYNGIVKVPIRWEVGAPL